MWAEISEEEAATRDHLIAQLHALGVRYLGGGQDSGICRTQPVESRRALILALAHSRDPRLRTALVALLLRHPEYAAEVEPIADSRDALCTIQWIRASILAAAALQRTWAFSLDLYLPGWQPINARDLAWQLQVPPPDEDYGRATLLALDRLLACDDPVPPDYRGAWEDVACHVLADLREAQVANVAR